MRLTGVELILRPQAWIQFFNVRLIDGLSTDAYVYNAGTVHQLAVNIYSYANDVCIVTFS